MKKTIIICILLISGLFISGCSDEPDGNALLNIHLNLAPGAKQQVEITRVVVTITGPDIDTQEVELKVEGRKATGVVAIPAGEEKLIKVKAYAGGNVEFEGEAPVDHPKPGQQIELRIQLKPTSQQEATKIFEIGNIGGVDNNPTSPTIFRLDKSYMITAITTYHWNYGQGSTPGTISLRDSSGKVYGPWQASGSDGQSAVKNAYWNVEPNIVLPAGTYTVIDSDPATWAQNYESNGQGFIVVYGYPADSGTPAADGDNEKMVLIPAGEFLMGSNNGLDREKPVHAVYLDDFYIDLYEVTNAQYKKFMDATGYKTPSYWDDPDFNAPDQPVVGVSWDDANAYAKWAGKRLPTEAEWEKAARGGLVSKEYSWGDDWPPPYIVGNFCDETLRLKLPDWPVITGYRDGYVYTAPVGSFISNNYGIYDMAGNVWEWVADWYDHNYYGISPKQNPKGPGSGSEHILRGGSWDYYDPSNFAVATREPIAPSKALYSVGFRCAKSAR